MVTKPSLPVHEIFGPTVQGEGSHAGRLVKFVRLHGCPVGCPWCDTGYSETENRGKYLPRKQMTVDEILYAIEDTGDRLPRTHCIVISGGEPTIHKELPALCERLIGAGHRVHLETSGSHWQELPVQVWVTLSPKEHVSEQFPVDPRMWVRADEYKIVVSEVGDIERYKRHLVQGKPVFLQPEWNQVEGSVRSILEILEEHPLWRLGIQMHKYIGVQ